MARYVKYVTQELDRWDIIAQRFYGDPYDYERIIVANPTIPISPILPPGRAVAIPVIERATAALTNLPPWKRGL